MATFPNRSDLETHCSLRPIEFHSKLSSRDRPPCVPASFVFHLRSASLGGGGSSGELQVSTSDAFRFNELTPRATVVEKNSPRYLQLFHM